MQKSLYERKRNLFNRILSVAKRAESVNWEHKSLYLQWEGDTVSPTLMSPSVLFDLDTSGSIEKYEVNNSLVYIGWNLSNDTITSVVSQFHESPRANSRVTKWFQKLNLGDGENNFIGQILYDTFEHYPSRIRERGVKEIVDIVDDMTNKGLFSWDKREDKAKYLNDNEDKILNSDYVRRFRKDYKKLESMELRVQRNPKVYSKVRDLSFIPLIGIEEDKTTGVVFASGFKYSIDSLGSLFPSSKLRRIPAEEIKDSEILMMTSYIDELTMKWITLADTYKDGITFSLK